MTVGRQSAFGASHFPSSFQYLGIAGKIATDNISDLQMSLGSAFNDGCKFKNEKN